jgi:hypothetical protein
MRLGPGAPIWWGRGPLAIRSRAPPPVRDGAGNERASGAVESAGGDARVEGTAGDRWRLEGPATSGVASELGRSQCCSVICETTLRRRQRGRRRLHMGPAARWGSWVVLCRL